MASKLLGFVAAMRRHSVKSDHGLGGECVDLVEAWAAVLRKGAIPGNAADLLNSADASQWQVVPNGPTNAPSPGDIVVWRQTALSASIGIGVDGHCAIAVAADPMWLLSFDQNWPTGSPAELVVHGYLGVAGWLQPR